MGKTLGFYQNFNLDLHRLSTALRCIQADPEMGQNALAQCMGVNQPVAEGFSAWLRHTGLATIQSNNKSKSTLFYQLSPFGELVSRYGTAPLNGERAQRELARASSQSFGQRRIR